MPGEPESDTHRRSIGLLHKSLSLSKTIYKGAGLRRTDSMPGPGPLKRRKTLGLNTRFDRMLSQVNVTHSYSSDPKARPKRVRSSGSSSVSSYDLPKTPVDAYSHLRENRLGGDFSVLKMDKRALNPSKSPVAQHGPAIRVKTYEKNSQAQMQTPIKMLPSWLASTFSALEPEHPLRELLPPSFLHEDEMEPRTRNDPPQGAGDNSIFAFSPFDAGNIDASHETPLCPPVANHTLCDDEFLPCDLATVNAEMQAYHLGEDLGFRPFSTPGTLAVLQHIGISNVTSNSANSSGSQQNLAHVNKRLPSNNASLSAGNATFTSSPILRQTMPDPETSLSCLHHGSSITSNALGHNSLIPDFQENELPMNIFSTPGPTFTVSRPVYFDSPTEDPTLSDPLEPESYELDLDALDFRWRPFLRKSLPDHSLTNPPNSSLHASVTFPAVFEEPDYPYLHLPGDITHEQAAKTDAHVECDFLDEFLRGSPVSGHAIQQTSLCQLNGQSRTGGFARTLGIVISPPPSPVIPDLADVKDEQEKIQRQTVSPHERNILITFQLVSPKLVSAIDCCIPESHEQPFTPPRPSQTSQPTTPKKDRQSQMRSTQDSPRQEQRSSVSWMLSRRSMAARDITGHEEIEGLPSQRSDTSHDTIESWADNY